MENQPRTRSLKDSLKKLLPPSINIFKREMQRVLDAVQENKQINENCLVEVKQLKQMVNECSRGISELKYSETFTRTIGGEWLKNTSFSPGGSFAVGYPFLYVMYRALDEMRPNSILELGLGQSTKMLGQYAAFKKINHYVVEHDISWIDFFRRRFVLSEYTQIVKLKTIMERYKDSDAVRVYENFENTFKGRKFDFICIDAPFGYDMPLYSRIDVLKLLPNCLDESFAIMIDDYQRIGEQNTVQEIKNALSSNGIKYSTNIYSGDKDLCIICSSDLSFLCTL